MKLDNTSDVSAINKMGSKRSIPMDKTVQEIWHWAIQNNNWLTATHIPGILNVEADRESRKCETRIEWMLNKEVFNYVIDTLDFQPDIDLFASRINSQLDMFYSYRPDPECQAVDAFTINWHNKIFYAFPPFTCIARVIQKIWNDEATGILIVRPPIATTTEGHKPSNAQDTATEGSNRFREILFQKQFSPEISSLLLASWGENTQNSYNMYIKKWITYCQNNNVDDIINADYKIAMSFLTKLFYHDNWRYGSIAAARSALSAILHTKMLNLSVKMSRSASFLEGCLSYAPASQNIPGQGGQIIGALRTDYCHYGDNCYTFYIPTILKTTKPGKHQEPLRFLAYSNNPKLCIVNCLQEYLERTNSIRENLENQPKQLLLSYAYPHKPVGVATIARYIKLFLGLAGIDITVFTAHSVRSVSTSKANNLSLNIKDIQKAAGWASDTCFRKFHNLPITENFGTTLLKNN
ncbi:uncharacterized protein LOC130614434 [Hydractinia symbiolongicarpus]|uniref:uncharacterized protein LOC130614434 n=1 Tax=Hydractinia symbiolongicarpus TaxID=13093 RepID=UPI00254A2644|nr:uncharacterized protein LOC130614434 [Hydractinia symbiolongicarpus]